MKGLNPSVVRRARSRTVLEGWNVVEDGRSHDKNGNFAAQTSKLMAKKRKGGNFMEKSCKRGTFYKENSSTGGRNHRKFIDVSGSSTDESREDSKQSLAAEDASPEDQPLTADSSSEEQSSEEEEEQSEEEEEPEPEPESSSSESEERSDKEGEMEREPAIVIEVSSGPSSDDEAPQPPRKIYGGGPSSRTRSKKPTIIAKIHAVPESSSRKWLAQPSSSVSKQQKKKKKEKKTKEKKEKGRKGNNLRRSDDRVAEDVHDSDMLSCTGRSSKEEEEEVQGEAVSEEDIALKNQVIEEARKRKDRLKSAVKSNRQFSQLLTNLMWQDGDEIAQMMQPEPGKVREVLPRFFKYWETEEPKQVEKTEEDIEMDALWTQMDLLLNNDTAASSAQACDEEEVVGVGKCPKGKHRLVLKEEIGLVCSICSHVETEITAMDPSSFEKAVPSKRRDRDRGDRRSLDNVDMDVDDEDDDSENGSSAEQFAEDGTVWDLVPRIIRSSLFPHQKEGFEFMWKNVGGSINLEELSSCSEEVGGGCIISHAPGTGKTRLTLVFLQAYAQRYPKSCPIVIAPAGMLQTWEEEFNKCKIDIPFHNINNEEFSMKEKPELLKLVSDYSHLKNKDSTRLVKLYSWTKTTSVLGISYSLFAKLVQEPPFVKLLEIAGVVVLDEGHIPRNNDSDIWNALCKLKTRKRIILSGTPFQNNCNELQNTFKLVRPREERPVAAKLDNLKRSEDSVRAEILKKALTPYAHVYKGSILQDTLPGLRSCFIFVNPTEYQSKIIQTLPRSGLIFEFEHKEALLTVHPSLVLNSTLSEKEAQAIKSEKERLVQYRGDAYQGAKTWFLVEFVRLCMAAKEKVLIFSQYKSPLKLIREQLCAIYKWSEEDQEVLIMSGEIGHTKRQNLIRRFNDPYSEAVVLLASTKACSEGITLVGASRVILLDTEWNPSVERQAISRAYRLGQEKLVYTYHLMLKGSSELSKYVKQAKKQKLSEFMFSNSSSGDAVVGPPSSNQSDEDMILDMMRSSRPDLDKLFHKVMFQPRENNLMEKFGLVDQP